MAKDVIDELQADWREQRPDLDAEAIGVVLRIQALDRILTGQAEERLGAFGLQWWEYDALAALRRRGEPFMASATELAESVMLTSGALTNRVDGLEQRGLVRREADRADRRRVLVRLTRKGLELIDSATEARFQAASAALSDLPSEDRSMLSELLRRVLLEQS